MTTSQTVASDIAALLRARNPLLWIVTKEEARAEKYIFEAAQSARYVPYTWDTAAGQCNMAGQAYDRFVGEIDAMLGFIRQQADSGGERAVYILRDAPVWLRDMPGAMPCRALRNLARFLPGTPRDSAHSVIILTPSSDIPPELAGHATLIEWPMPDREEIAGILDATLSALPTKIREKALADDDTRDAAIDAAVGLSGEETQACYARSLVQLRKIDPATVASEKKRLIARERVLEWIDPLPGGLNAIGGLDVMKGWLGQRKLAYSPEARAYGLPAPRGTLIVGVSGCGKSESAKATATAWGVPLLRMDLGALKSKFVGESESNLRAAFRVIGAVGRCVVWLDEVEKGLQGATSGSADGGVSADALGAILTWMQERPGEAFVIATANDVSALPPEFLRKGRFDEMWFVDLPNATERPEIVRAALRKYKRSDESVDCDVVADACEGFTGAEIAALVPEALFSAFADKAREITTDDLLHAAASVVPLSKTAAQKITKLREWAKGGARAATSIESGLATKRKARRAPELDMVS